MLIKQLLSALLAMACVACQVQDPASALTEKPTAPAARALTADAQTRKIVDAADAFLATLTETQKKAALFAFTDSAQRARWSNFPSDFVKRYGVRWGEMNATQQAALMNLLGAVLSPKGVKMVQEQMAADDIVKVTEPNAIGGRRLPTPQPGGPVTHFGSDYFFVSFVGTPSTTSPWMFQLGAHHLAINATVVGPNITLSPTLTGGEPLHYIDKDGKPHYIVEDEATKAMTLLNGLTAEQRSKVVISTKLINLILGPGHDGQTLQPEGLPGSDMTVAQQAQFLAVIESRIGILNADDSAATMTEVRKNLKQSYFAWYGPTNEVGTGYFRVTGPTLIIEFAPQENDPRFPAPAEHAHNMYRDPTNEYGAAWTVLK
jgi:hypothetical protein